MAPGGSAARADAMAALAKLVHDHVADDRIGDMIEAARASALDSWEVANLEDIHRRWVRARAVDSNLVSAHSKAVSSCQNSWLEARERNDWNAVSGELQTVLDLSRQRACAIGAALECEPYDALLEEWEPDLTRAVIDPIFAEIKRAVPPLIETATVRQPAPLAISGPFPVERQKALTVEMMRVLGFDFNRGRIDTSAHPFTGGVPDDTRITTRYDVENFQESLFSTIHEVGHAIYEQQLPSEHRKQPVGQAAGLAVHESQSLLFEKLLARSDPFLEFAAPILQRTLLGQVSDAHEWQPQNLARLVRRVERGFIRTDADELTYPLHVILRYELEIAMIDSELAAADLPHAWEAKMSEYLGLPIRGDHRAGCLQDIHHYLGLLAYFPTYTIGAVMAAQLFRAARAAIPDLDDAIRNGEFAGLIDWLRDHVHGRGRSASAMAIVADATGSNLNPAAYIDHLRSRYSYS